MNWLKNLNASPRLMLSHGALIVLIAAISYLSISSLSEANDRVESLYHRDMIGASKADGITINVATIGRLSNNAIAYAAQPAVITSNRKQVLANLAELHANLDEADKLFDNRVGLEKLAFIRSALPGYEQALTTLFRALDAKDTPASMTAGEAVEAARKTIREASDIARASKLEHAEQQYQKNKQAFQSSRLLSLSAAAFAVVLGVLLSIFIARAFSVPLGQAVATLEMMAGCDLTVSLDVHTADEVGQMAAALNTALEKLRTSLQQVAASSSNSDSTSRELAAAAEKIATGAQEQSANLEETSASLEQITAAVRQSADNAKQASQLATDSRESAEQGQEVVSSAIAAMAEINISSAKISEIISTINEIAFQTNLLAVNAAVEAARAGEEGRGFAVVASEVRTLAQRSAEAAKEIKNLIQDSLQKVEKGTELVNRSGSTLQGIVASVKRVTDIVGEIAAAASEQSTGVEQVNTAITKMGHVTQSNSAATEELASAAQTFADEAKRLAQLVGHFTLGEYNLREPLRQRQADGTPSRLAKAAAGKLASSASSGRKQRSQ